SRRRHTRCYRDWSSDVCSSDLDREDYREGLLTTLPLVSKQSFEIWRRDVVTVPAIAQSTLATFRRTVRFQFSKREDGGYIAAPRSEERRVGKECRSQWRPDS